MGRIVVAAFKPKPGCEGELQRVMAERLPLLRRLGLATERAHITMQAADGTWVDVSEWVDSAAIDQAHQNPEVLALWERYARCCDYVQLKDLPESQHDFATFEAVHLPSITSERSN